MTRHSAEATLVAELLQMILHVSPEDLQRFAGKFGEDEAKLASAEFSEWAKMTEARVAVWHAGQVFAAASRLGQAQCRGFNAIAVYYASLTLWIFGLMIAPALSSLHVNVRREEQQVVINEPESVESKMFIVNGIGMPGLVIKDGRFVRLTDSDLVLGFARDVYRGNFEGAGEVQGQGGPLPPLVENLGNLLRDLGGLPGSRVSRAASEAVG